MNAAASDFHSWFRRLAGDDLAPYRWQAELAAQAEARSRLIRVPTGMGKTLGVLAAWSWHRIAMNEDRWPRRLVWCLPMRVLVEQTERVVRNSLARVGRLWDGAEPHDGKVGVHVLMGGIDEGSEWVLHPEHCAVLVGTQDMLLSRALNRGYGSGRARWPAEFGLLSHDALWVFDEVQLMDVGLATSAQLQAFHDEDTHKGFRPRLSWWMSATLQPSWLDTVDTHPHHAGWIRDPIDPGVGELPAAIAKVRKSIVVRSVAASDIENLATLCEELHRQTVADEHGRITLLVCNTVERACRAFELLHRRRAAADIRLVHGRFRPADRLRWSAEFLSREACTADADRIIVSTQVVEAGVDVSANSLVTDLAPWSSLVQRFGRCARYGGQGSIAVVDPGDEEDVAHPYTPAELAAARSALQRIAETGDLSGDVGVPSLDRFERTLDDDQRGKLYPFEPPHLLLRREFDELFDTTPDLTGADIDISRFIRSGPERDLQVFWEDVPPASKNQPTTAPDPQRRPRRQELCAVPFLLARDWLCGKPKKKTDSPPPRLRAGIRAWVWDWIDGRWKTADRASLVPGRIVCVAADSGGYRPDRGFDPESTESVMPVTMPPVPASVAAAAQSDEREDGDETSQAAWKTIASHGREVAETAVRVARDSGVGDPWTRLFGRAGEWHDVGKAHAAFQGAIRAAGRPGRNDIAKAPREAWLRPYGTYRTADDRDARPGLRHELASLLALFAVLQARRPDHPALLGPWREALALLGHEMPTAAASSATPLEAEIVALDTAEFDLLAYLVLSHHGKVRMTLDAGPKDQDYQDPGDGAGLPIRGIREGDRLPSIRLTTDGKSIPALSLSLAPATLGLSPTTGRSWNDRALGLLKRFGPGALAWLEAIFIAADRRASRMNTMDPLLTAEGNR